MQGKCFKGNNCIFAHIKNKGENQTVKPVNKKTKYIEGLLNNCKIKCFCC